MTNGSLLDQYWATSDVVWPDNGTEMAIYWLGKTVRLWASTEPVLITYGPAVGQYWASIDHLWPSSDKIMLALYSFRKWTSTGPIFIGYGPIPTKRYLACTVTKKVSRYWAIVVHNWPRTSKFYWVSRIPVCKTVLVQYWEPILAHWESPKWSSTGPNVKCLWGWYQCKEEGHTYPLLGKND